MPERRKKPFYRDLFFQVIVAIAAGVALGYAAPRQAVAMKPLADGFINLIKMMIAPIIFCTIVSGIAGMGDLRRVGRVGLKAVLWFEGITTLALVIGLALANLAQPGSGLYIAPAPPDAALPAAMPSGAGFFLHMIPATLVSALSGGEILQVLLVAILFACAAGALGENGKAALDAVEAFSRVLFKMVDLIILAAPVGAFGAIAYTVGRFGVGSLEELGELVALFYLAGLLFIALVLGAALRLCCGLSLWRFLRYIREEIMIVLGTSSSETVLPRLMEKLAAMGCARPVVGLVVPAGYSFNLDGSSLYFTLGALFIAYAAGTPLAFGQELTLLGVLLIASKGAAGVTGSGFIVLAATLPSLHLIPPPSLQAGLALLFAVDRFMSTGRALVNVIGNGVAAVVIARWEKALDYERAAAALNA